MRQRITTALTVIVIALIIMGCASDKPFEPEPPGDDLSGVVLNLNPDESLTWTCLEHKIPMAVWDTSFVAGDTVWCARGDMYRIKWIKWI